MTHDDDRAEWVARWQAASPRLAAIRVAELEHVDVSAFIDAMNDAFAAARVEIPPSRTSGLVEQQRLFAKLRS